MKDQHSRIDTFPVGAPAVTMDKPWPSHSRHGYSFHFNWDRSPEMGSSLPGVPASACSECTAKKCLAIFGEGRMAEWLRY